jgi:adenylosuccinate synthase
MDFVHALREKQPKDIQDEIDGLLKAMEDDNISSQRIYIWIKNFATVYKKQIVNGQQFLNDYLTQKKKGIIFEGAQGALLDRFYGFYPYITKTKCNFSNISQLTPELKILRLGRFP